MRATATPFGRGAIALYLTGFVAFVGLYLPQPILPLLAQDFGVGVHSASLMITATIFGIALTAPLVGIVSDHFGRRSLLIGSSALLSLVTLGCAVAADFWLLLLLRFGQGLLLPGLFAVGVAYLADVLPAAVMGAVAGIYVAASVVGGMVGRVLAGALADTSGWRYGFVVAALLYALLLAVWWALPPLRAAVSRASGRSWAETVRGTVAHLRNRSILAGLLVGFCLFFAFQATFTYLPFRLERPPFSFGSTLIGLSYLTYTSGVIGSGVAGWFRRRAGLRTALFVGFALAIAGNLLALAPALSVLLPGLLVLCFGNWLVQGLALGHVATAAQNDRAGANALYLTLYYLGGSLGAFAPGYLFAALGYGGVVASSVAALGLGMIGVALLIRNEQGRSDGARAAAGP